MQEPRRVFKLFIDDENEPTGQRLEETLEFDDAVQFLAETRGEEDNGDAWSDCTDAFDAVFAGGDGNPDIRFGDNDEYVLSPYKYNSDGSL